MVWAQSFMINEVTSGQQPVTSGVLQGSILGLFLVNVFRGDLCTAFEGTLSLQMSLNWKKLLTTSKVDRPCREILTKWRGKESPPDV